MSKEIIASALCLAFMALPAYGDELPPPGDPWYLKSEIESSLTCAGGEDEVLCSRILKSDLPDCASYEKQPENYYYLKGYKYRHVYCRSPLRLTSDILAQRTSRLDEIRQKHPLQPRLKEKLRIVSLQYKAWDHREKAEKYQEKERERRDAREDGLRIAGVIGAVVVGGVLLWAVRRGGAG